MRKAAETAPVSTTRPERKAVLRVTARPHWVNAWLLRSTARPHLRLDGTEHPLVWSRAQTFPVDPGQHRLQTFWRYRGTRTPLGIGSLQLHIGAGEEVVVLARNGPLNQQPLQPRLQAQRPDSHS